MDFKINSIVNSTISTISTFKDHVLSGLSPLEKRVLEVAIVIFSCVTLYCVMRSFLKKKNTRTLTDGTKETGTFNDKKELDGKGKRVYYYGEVEEGDFKKGVFISGTQTKANGTKLEGTFNSNGQLNGENCTMTFTDGTKETGTFKNGIYQK